MCVHCVEQQKKDENFIFFKIKMIYLFEKMMFREKRKKNDLEIVK